MYLKNYREKDWEIYHLFLIKDASVSCAAIDEISYVFIIKSIDTFEKCEIAFFCSVLKTTKNKQCLCQLFSWK